MSLLNEWLNKQTINKFKTVCVCVYSVQKVSSHVIWKTETFTEGDTRYKKHCTQDNDTSVPFLKVGTLGVSHSSPNHHQLPHCIFLNLIEIFSLSKVILVLEKARSHRVPNLACKWAESPGWLMFCQKTVHETWCMSGHVVVMKLPITSCP